MDSISVADRLERQQQAIKGLVQTLSSIRDGYCTFLTKVPLEPGSNMTPATKRMYNLIVANGAIFEAITGVNSLHTCFVASVIANCTASAFRALPGAAGNAELAKALEPLDKIVERKVWSVDERKKLFTTTFTILGAFGEMYAHLINEVREAFPEETAQIEVKLAPPEQAAQLK